MKQVRDKFHVALLLALCFSFPVNSKVAFYESENFIGLMAEMASPDECVNLPRRAYDQTTSLATEACVMVYKGENCTQNSIEVKPGSYSNLSNVTHAHNENFVKSIRSFHQCREHIGSSGKLNVTFYEDNQLIAEYSNICDCITLPDLTNQATRLKNHGTCVRLYLSSFGGTPGCTGNYHTLLGGTSYISENLRNLTHSSSSWKRIAAISPCSEELTKCVKLQATVIKFEIDSDPNAVSTLSSSSDISMSTTTTILNNGSAIVSEEYTAKKSIIETTETKLVESYSIMDNWTVETGVSTEFTADIPLVSKTTVTASLTSAYTIEESSSWEQEEIKRTETCTEFSVSQKIEIKPCTSYNVNSFVKMVHNYPVNYKVYSQVSGSLGSRQLTAAEIKDRLENLEYIRDHDNYTVIAMGEGTMSVDYGVETVIDGDGSPIEGCLISGDRGIPQGVKDQKRNLEYSSSAKCSTSLVILPISVLFIFYSLIKL